MSLHLVSILKSPMRIMFSYFSKALRKVVVISLKKYSQIRMAEMAGGGVSAPPDPQLYCVAIQGPLKLRVPFSIYLTLPFFPKIGSVGNSFEVTRNF